MDVSTFVPKGAIQPFFHSGIKITKMQQQTALSGQKLSKLKFSPAQSGCSMKGYNFRVQISYDLAEVCRCLPVHVGASSSKSCWKWKESQSLFWQPSLRHWPALVIWTSTLCRRHISTYGKIKTHFAQTYFHMPPSMYLNTVMWTIRLIQTGRLQHQHLSLSHLYLYSVYKM